MDQGKSENIDEISNSLSNDISGVRKLRKEFSKTPILSYLDLNSLGGKFDSFENFVLKQR